jgi:Ser/Thr protein kinase RdoA (MazF antagonist)
MRFSAGQPDSAGNIFAQLVDELRMMPMDEERKRLSITAARSFVEPGTEIRIGRLGNGNINETYLVESSGHSFVLQRINNHVFPRPDLVVENFRAVTAHLATRDRTLFPQWQDIRLIPTLDGQPFYRDGSGGIWRSQGYIEKTTTFSTIDTTEQARQVGWALGHFHQLVADLPGASLHETLPGFHVLASYLDHFDRVAQIRQVRNSPELRSCFRTVETFRTRMHVLRQAEVEGLLVPHIIHGDPKAANVLFDRDSDQAVCLIDLDTVRPGLLLYDIGDCLRSCCNPSGEQGFDPEAVCFETDLAHEILTGYSAGAGTLFTLPDRAHVFDAVCLLSFELGLRFLTDYMDGNCYFHIEDDEDNLHRAFRQFRLLTTIIATGGVFQ